MVWNDEFDDPDIDTVSWNFETGDGTDFDLPPGWGNDELQIYTSDAENAAIGEDAGESVLMITAREDGFGGYTSARMTTEDKVSIRYGKIIASIKLPETQGIWPAFWMLGDNIDEVSWPGSGEIDVLELLGQKPDETFHTIHYVNGEQSYQYNGNEYLSATSFSAGYHEFMLDWTPDSLTFSVDGNEAHMITITDDMKEFQRSFHLLLNIAVGGRLPGSPDDTTVFPQTMYVDYIRVYEQDGFTPEPPPELDIDEETVGGFAGEANPAAAILEAFDNFGTVSFGRFGAGGEPDWFDSSNAVDGEQSVRFAYPGGTWGGAWIAMDTPADFSSFSDGDLVFALNRPANATGIEIKLEGVNQSSDGSLFLENYTSTDLGNGWEEFRIPIADFVADGLQLDQIAVPFALWNPMDADGNFPQVDILFDAIRLE
jgi:beta-glucanase (GH16 family)